MRDILITLIVIGAVPFILSRPHIGVLLWSWLGYMNPHRLTWGFAYTMPFAQIAAIVTLGAFLFDKNKKVVPWTREVIVLILFNIWMLFTTFFAFNSEGAWLQWDKVWKIQLMTFVTMLLINSKERLHQLIWIICLSLGFYGIKGGIFSVLTGGSYRVWGPPGSFIGGNNEIGLALIMLIPLLRYLQLNTSRLWLRMGLLGAMLLSFVSILGTHSRGALLGLAMMGSYLLLKSRKKFLFMPIVLAVAIVGWQFMPQEWHDRMQTIENFQEDKSAMGRINAWGFALNMAIDRPFVGGGFESFRGWLFARYAPDPTDVHDAHSIYFEILGEHGFVGLFLFLILAAFTYLSARWCVKQAKGIPECRQLGDLATMIQVSLIGYASAGAFLGLAYFDFYYHLVAIVVASKVLIKKHLEENQPGMEVVTNSR